LSFQHEKDPLLAAGVITCLLKGEFFT